MLLRSLQLLVLALVVVSVAPARADPVAPAPRPVETKPAATAAAPPAPAPAAATPPLQRYQDEAPLGYARATLVKSAIARTASQGGGDVTLLAGGTEVSQVAERGTALLVSFADPADPSKREMGWIPASAMHPELRRPCAHGESIVATTLGSFCAQICRDARDCGADEACVPAGSATAQAGRITDALSYCVH